MVLPLYLYFNSNKFIQNPFILQLFHSIDVCFSFLTHIFSSMLHIVVRFDAFMSYICILNHTYDGFSLSLLVHI